MIMNNTIIEELTHQSTPSLNGTCNFICSECKNYKGSCICEKGVFIAFVGANIPLCSFYEWGKHCPHCGRNI